jgi:hypothetical protein
MKKLGIILVSIAVIGMIGYLGLRFMTKLASPEVNIDYNKNGLSIKTFYCQPSKKGRNIFGEVVPFNKVWRTGANESTQITFEQDVKIAGQPLKAGAYTFFTIPQKDKWIVIFNSHLGTWGHYSYNESEDVLRIEVTPTTTENTVEKLAFSYQETDGGGVNLNIAWDTTQINVPISL